MQMFDVYPVVDVELVRGDGAWVWDASGRRYLDFYGGHAVISIGHAHPRWTAAIAEQSGRLAFYSNSVRIPEQERLAAALGRVSGCDEYRLFLCNSGAEANENALKLASFRTGRSGVFAFHRAFHGRTSAAVAVTDNPNIRAAVNRGPDIRFLPLNDSAALAQALAEAESHGALPCAVIIEGIQGVGGIHEADDDFLRAARQLCDSTGTMLVLDEVQSGYGRSGSFFAFQRSGIEPDLVTVAKGMGNGFPIGGVLIHPSFVPAHGMLGTTFGGNHLACAAAEAVLAVIDGEGLIERAGRTGEMLRAGLDALPGVRAVRGRGLMLGVDVARGAEIRSSLLHVHGIFTGSASHPDTIRLLPPLTIDESHVQLFLDAFRSALYDHPHIH